MVDTKQDIKISEEMKLEKKIEDMQQQLHDAERRWNFVKWTNGDPKSTRKLDWIWGDLGSF